MCKYTVSASWPHMDLDWFELIFIDFHVFFLIFIDFLQHFLRIAMFLKCTHSWSYYRHSTSYYTFNMLPHIQQATTHSTNYYTSNKLLHIRSTYVHEHWCYYPLRICKKKQFQNKYINRCSWNLCFYHFRIWKTHIFNTITSTYFPEILFFFPSTFLKI